MAIVIIPKEYIKHGDGKDVGIETNNIIDLLSCGYDGEDSIIISMGERARESAVEICLSLPEVCCLIANAERKAKDGF